MDESDRKKMEALAGQKEMTMEEKIKALLEQDMKTIEEEKEREKQEEEERQQERMRREEEEKRMQEIEAEHRISYIVLQLSKCPDCSCNGFCDVDYHKQLYAEVLKLSCCCSRIVFLLPYSIYPFPFALKLFIIAHIFIVQHVSIFLLKPKEI